MQEIDVSMYPEPSELDIKEGLKIDADKYLKTWRKLRVEWATEFPELQGIEQLDPVEHLLPLDVGKLYKKITETDKGRRLYGYIPLMATSSYAQIGALNAESFCERILRCAGHVLTEGNTLLADDELEMLVILRMNREFMQHVREHYPDLMTGHFGRSVVNEEDGDSDEDA